MRGTRGSGRRRSVGRWLRNARGPSLLGIWLFGPPLLVQSADGGLRVSLGANQGQYEVVSRGCDGSVLSTRPVPVRTAATAVEYEHLRSRVRLATVAGVTSESGSLAQSYAYGGALLALEARRVGVGLGAVRVPAQTFPSMYLRIGDRVGSYFQADFLTPGALTTATGVLRAGMGVQLERINGLFGLSVGRALDLNDEGDHGGAFAQLGLGVSERLDFIVGGSWFGSVDHPDWGAGVGLRMRLGAGGPDGRGP